MNKFKVKPLPEEMKLSEFMKLPTRKEHFKQLEELYIKECDNKNFYELIIDKQMEASRMRVDKGIGLYMYGYSYTEQREKDIVPPRLQAIEDKVWIPTLKYRLEIVKIIDD